MKISKYFILLLLLFLSVTAFSLELEVNNQKVSTADYSDLPVIINDRTYVPLRFVSDALGYEVDWDSAQKQVLIFKNESSSELIIPDNNNRSLRIVLEGQPLFIPYDYGQPFINQNSRTMVPVRAISESMNFTVSFSNNTVSIKRPLENIPPSAGSQTTETSQEKTEEVSSVTDNNLSGINLWDVSIMGEPIATREQLVAYTKNRANSFRLSVPQQYKKPYLEVPEYLIDYFLDIGREYNIRGDIAYMQAIHETNFFQFTGIVQPYQNNFAGIAATGVACTGLEPLRGVSSEYIVFEPGVHGVTFSSPRVGVEAQIQHLYAYATSAPLPPGKELLNPRYELLKMLNRIGTAEKWVDLGGTWAVPGYDSRSYASFEDAYKAGQTYGQIILDRYLAFALKY